MGIRQSPRGHNRARRQCGAIHDRSRRCPLTLVVTPAEATEPAAWPPAENHAPIGLTFPTWTIPLIAYRSNMNDLQSCEAITHVTSLYLHGSSRKRAQLAARAAEVIDATNAEVRLHAQAVETTSEATPPKVTLVGPSRSQWQSKLRRFSFLVPAELRPSGKGARSTRPRMSPAGKTLWEPNARDIWVTDNGLW